MDINYPTPSFYISSGQGLYIIWLLEKTVATQKSKKYWRQIELGLIKLFKGFGADERVKDPARVLRIPGTINSKNGNMVKIVESNNIRYEMRDIAEYFWGVDIGVEEEKPKINKPKKANKNTNVTTFKSVKNLHYTRAKDIETLVKLRANKLMEGIRENLLFIYRLQLLMAYTEQEIALNMTLELNKKFSDPLCENEVISATQSAVTNAELYFKFKNEYEEEKEKLKSKNEKMKITLNKYLVNSGVYLYKNKTIIEELNITPVEMEHMKTLINMEIKKAHREISNKEYYIKNKDKFKKLYNDNLKEQGKLSRAEQNNLIRGKIKRG